MQPDVDRYPDQTWTDHGRNKRPGDTPWYLAMVVGLISMILIIVLILLIRGDGDEIEITTQTTAAGSPTLPSTTVGQSSTASTSASAGDSSTTETSTTETSTTETSTSSTVDTSASTTVTTTATTLASTTTTVDPEVYRSAVWPWFESATRYDDPVAAAEGFATAFLGFDDPISGQFLQGDARSGEVEIRPDGGGPVTTVFVRLLGTDGSWWVLGSAAENIIVEAPTALAEIGNPLLVSGRALAFEGVVGVQLRVDGTSTPLIDGTVSGGGTELEPFTGEFPWTGSGAESGTLVLFTEGMEDGSTWAASVVRVTLPTG